MNNDFLVRYERNLIEENTKEVTVSIAKNFKDVLPDEIIAECIGLPLEVVKEL